MKRHAKCLVGVIKNVIGNPLTGAEVGVWCGGMSAALLKTFPDLRLLMVDAWEVLPRARSMRFDGNRLSLAMIKAKHVTEFAARRRRLLKSTSKDAAESLWPGLLDFVFIDANHRYEAVAEDVRLWHPLVREGGIVAGHDYRGKMDRRGKWGVQRTVDEWAEEVGATVEFEGWSHVWWYKR